MKRKYSFILTKNISYGCRHCGDFQRISAWDWVALLACKMHERTCGEDS